MLADSNAELICCYEVVRDDPETLLDELHKLKVAESEYYRLRALRPEQLEKVQRAARFIYLNKTCFNGLYRVNKRGEFNTPFGKYANVTLADGRNIAAVSRLLKRVRLLNDDYTNVVASAEAGDFIYFDPPFLPVSKFSDFKRYTKKFFYTEDHEKLASLFADLAKRGCYVLLSNSCHEHIVRLYSGFRQEKVKVPRFVNCKGEGRGSVNELLISNYEPRY